MWNIRKIVKCGDYLFAVVPEHPKRYAHNYVLLHRVLMENHLGRLLRDGEQVHHKNENTKDNDISNLEVMLEIEHKRHHASKIGRLWVVLKCPACNRIFEKPKNDTHLNKNKSHTTCSRKCGGVFGGWIKIGRTKKVLRGIENNVVRIYKRRVGPDGIHRK